MMMTKLTYLGHACFLFETDSGAILTDPWLSPNGAFLGTWRQLPPNDHVLPLVIEKMKAKPVLIYLTHEHEDHYDEETLRVLLPHAAGICIPNYENKFLKKLIEKNLGLQPLLINENVMEDFHGIRYKIFIDESGINRDSAIFIKAPGLSFFDGNDCKIFDRAQWLLGNCGPIDVLSSQFSGANMHPICYEMPPEEYQKVSRQKKMRKFVAVRNFIHDLRPKYYIPSAGPAVFPYPEHYELNFQEDSIFPKWWQFKEYLESKNDPVAFVPLAVGGSISAEKAGEHHFDGIAKPMSDEDVKGAIEYYRNVDACRPVEPLPGDAETLAFFEREMNKKIAVLSSNAGIRFDCPLYFEVRNHAGVITVYRIHPDNPALEVVTGQQIEQPYYLHRTNTEALGKLIRSGKGWGTYFLSFLFRSRRVPDTFDSVMGTFFVANDDDDLSFGLKKLAEFKQSDEHITLASPDGKSTVTCRRFCPHQGADLKYARFDGRYVTCPRHQWRFDCENGGKADNSNDTIDATIEKKAVV
jgi:UDP-MurNAc hydroxylase